MLRSLQQALHTRILAGEFFQELPVLLECGSSLTQTVQQHALSARSLCIRVCEPQPQTLNYEAPQLFVAELLCPVQVEEPAGWGGSLHALEVAQKLATHLHLWVPPESTLGAPFILAEKAFWKVLQTPVKDGAYRLQLNFLTSTFLEPYTP
ncbi:MAG: hypothetical protein JW739_01545 [Opitutales bacterium]|nr:hypothetical protein [Opitutales bacterium]